MAIFSPLSRSLRKCVRLCRRPAALPLVDQLVRGQREELDVLVVGGDVLEELGALVELAFGAGVFTFASSSASSFRNSSAVTLRPSSSTPLGERIHCQTCEREISAVAASSIRL